MFTLRFSSSSVIACLSHIYVTIFWPTPGFKERTWIHCKKGPWFVSTMRDEHRRRRASWTMRTIGKQGGVYNLQYLLSAYTEACRVVVPFSPSWRRQKMDAPSSLSPSHLHTQDVSSDSSSAAASMGLSLVSSASSSLPPPSTTTPPASSSSSSNRYHPH